jgi:hypothetical protein
MTIESMGTIHFPYVSYENPMAQRRSAAPRPSVLRCFSGRQLALKQRMAPYTRVEAWCCGDGEKMVVLSSRNWI